LLTLGLQIVQVTMAGKYWTKSPDGGPAGMGLRVRLTLLFPK
jgi:hypothetical protein